MSETEMYRGYHIAYVTPQTKKTISLAWIANIGGQYSRYHEFEKGALSDDAQELKFEEYREEAHHYIDNKIEIMNAEEIKNEDPACVGEDCEGCDVCKVEDAETVSEDAPVASDDPVVEDPADANNCDSCQ
jgi:hypothetical protein